MFEAIKAVAGLAGSTPWRLVLISSLLAGIGAFIYWYDSSRYQAGWDAAVVAHLEENKKATDEAVRDAESAIKDRLGDALTESEKRHQQALRLIEELRKPVEPPRPEVITEYITNSDCQNLGEDVKNLFNDYIGDAP